MLTHNCKTWIKVATKYVDGEYFITPTYKLPFIIYLSITNFNLLIYTFKSQNT
jgi:hypothetical protein